MTALIPCTRWYKFNDKTNCYEIDTVEEGHSQVDKPVTGLPGKYRKQFGYLNESGEFQPVRV